MDPLGDGKSNVEVLCHMGDDLMVVNAARVSFAKTSTQLTEGDVKLIKYLARNNHITPFFHPQVQFRLKMPIFVLREWMRSNIGFARNEVSRRYVDFKAECWIPKPEEIRARDPNLKQGSKPTAIENAEEVHETIMKASIEASVKAYEDLLAKGVAPEIARGVLPNNLYSYARLCKLRLDPHAQKEIQLYAQAIDTQMRKLFPVSWAALMGDV
jgi:thymidylate synthase (FAD)